MPPQRPVITSILLWTLSLTGSSTGSAQAEAPVPDPAQAALIEKGELLYQTASCVGCHSWPQGGGAHLAAGRFAQSEFGYQYSPNISPDPETGIGNWTEEDFFRALRQGRSPTGKRYWPTFPYLAYTKLTDEDIRALWAYLQSQPPIYSPNGEHDIDFPYNMPGLIRIWRGLFFEEGAFEADPSQSAQWNRGAYISSAMIYCGMCHSPRSAIGRYDPDFYMAGGINRGKDITEVSPNLTPDETYGIGDWTKEDIVEFLTSGMKPDGSSTTLIMREKVDETTRLLSLEDKQAVAEYLLSLPAVHYQPPAE